VETTAAGDDVIVPTPVAIAAAAKKPNSDKTKIAFFINPPNLFYFPAEKWP
jgi:hypothetical protein